MTKYETDKPFKTIDEQINILANERNLKIPNIESAKVALSRYGYYEIINGYKDNFMIDSKNDDLGFKPHADFEHIYSLFSMDQELRNWVIDSLEFFEANLRQVVAYVIANNISEHQDKYINRRKYNTGRKYYKSKAHKYVYPVDDLMRTLTRATKSQKEPFNHYRTNHGNVPPWIIVKQLSLGNLIWWTRLLKRKEKDAVISAMLGIPIPLLNNSQRTLFGEFLDVCLNYRNTAAHGGRIYNHYSSKHRLSFESAKMVLDVSNADYRNGKGQSRLGVLFNCLRLLSNQEPFIFLKSGINVSVKKYLKTYPEDLDFILSQMELEKDSIDI